MVIPCSPATAWRGKTDGDIAYRPIKESTMEMLTKAIMLLCVRINADVAKHSASIADALYLWVEKVVCVLWESSPDSESGRTLFRAQCRVAYESMPAVVALCRESTLKKALSQVARCLDHYGSDRVIAALRKDRKADCSINVLQWFANLADHVPTQSKDTKIAAKVNKSQGKAPTKEAVPTAKETKSARTGKRAKQGKQSASDVQGHADSAKHPLLAVCGAAYDMAVASKVSAKVIDALCIDFRTKLLAATDVAKEQRGIEVIGGDVTDAQARKVKARAQVAEVQAARTATM